MFKGKRTSVFWIGLTILAFGSTGLSTILWLILVYYPANYHSLHWDYPTYFPTYFWQYYIWFILGTVALVGIGLYMLKSGMKKKRS